MHQSCTDSEIHLHVVEIGDIANWMPMQRISLDEFRERQKHLLDGDYAVLDFGKTPDDCPHCHFRGMLMFEFLSGDDYICYVTCLFCWSAFEMVELIAAGEGFEA